MPASTSPYQNNDYGAVSNFRPYQLPVNDIYKAISAQSQFWEEGASRVKSVYDNALDLKLSLEPNQKIRDDYMKQADQQLTKLSSMDLSNPSIQRKGFDIFKPLLKDEGVIYDDAMTRHYDQVRSDALTARQKGDGKGYSDNNLAYAMDGYNEFINSKDRMAGKAFWGKRKEYTPYYDPTTDMNTALKNCKPDEYSNDATVGLNIVTHSNTALSALKLNGCLGTISDKAKRQLVIDGAVTYKNNLGALRDGYIPHLENTKEQLSGELATYQGILANKDHLAALTDEQLRSVGLTKDTITTQGPAVIKHLEDMVKDYTPRIDNLDKNIQQLRAGDLSSISGDNFEPVAGMVYTKGYMDSYSQAHSYFKDITKTTASPSEMLIYREDKIDDRLTRTIEADRQKELIKGYFKNGKLQTPQDVSGNAVLNSAFAATPGNEYNQITEERNNIFQQRGQLNTWYLNELKRMGMPDGMEAHFRAHDDTFQKWYQTFTKTAKGSANETVIADHDQRQQKLMLLEGIMKNNQDSIDAQIMHNSPELFDRSHLNGIDPIKIGKSTITANDVQNALEGQPNTAGLEVKQEYGNNPLSPGSYTTTESVYYQNGKKITDMHLNNYIHNIADKSAEKTSKLMAARNELAKTNTIIQKEGYVFPTLDDDKKDFKANMMSAVGITDEPKAFTVGQTDLRGNVEITIHDPATGGTQYDKKALLDRFRSTYGPQGKLIPIQGDKYHFIISGFTSLNKFTSPEVQMSELMAPYVQSLEKQVTNPAISRSTGLLRSKKDFSKLFGMEITAGPDPGSHKYRIYDGKGTTILYQDDRLKALETLNYALSNDDVNLKLAQVIGK